MKAKKRNYPALRVLTADGFWGSGGYKSGRKRWRGTPETASSAITRSAGTRPDFRQRCTAWYRTPNLSATDLSPPPPLIALKTASMTPTLQPPVAVRQQLRVAARFPKMQLMVVDSKLERERFAAKLNERVAQEHPETRGRPQWLQKRLKDFRHKAGRRGKVSVQTCAYWLAGTKIPKLENETLLCDALGMTRGELFGETNDPRLAAIIEAWTTLPEHQKSGVYSMVVPPAAGGAQSEKGKIRSAG